MKNVVLVIKDKIVGSFLSPFACANADDGVRAVANSVNSGTGLLSLNSQDFDLYKIAEFDTKSGEIVAISPMRLTSLQSLKNVVTSDE